MRLKNGLKMKKILILTLVSLLGACSIAPTFDEHQNYLLSQINVDARRMVHSCPTLNYNDIDSKLEYRVELFSAYTQNLSNADELYKASQVLSKMVKELETQYKDPKNKPSPAYCVDKLTNVSDASARLLRAMGSLER
jgi:hypothetical protein